MIQRQQCSHLDHVRDVTPSAHGCEECLKLGDYWVHLRISLMSTRRTVYVHFFPVSQDGAPHADLEGPPHAVARFDGERLYPTVNREVLSIVDDEESAARRLHIDDA